MFDIYLLIFVPILLLELKLNFLLPFAGLGALLQDLLDALAFYIL
jgi:hypothetical protein